MKPHYVCKYAANPNTEGYNHLHVNEELPKDLAQLDGTARNEVCNKIVKQWFGDHRMVSKTSILAHGGHVSDSQTCTIACGWKTEVLSWTLDKP